VSADVVVVGAGLSGLVVAFRMQRAGLAVEVLEAGERPGGVIGSTRRDGLLFERGPNTALDSGAVGALSDELGLRPLRIEAAKSAARRYLALDGGLVPVPHSAGSFIATPLFSARAKLRLLAEPFIVCAPEGQEETVAQFVRRRLGPEFLERAVEPLVSGILAGDPDDLSLAAAFPRLAAMESLDGSLFRGALRALFRRRQGAARARATTMSFRNGMQTLTDALAAALQLTCGARVTRLAPLNRGGFEIEAERGGAVETRRAREVVLALPAFAAADLMRPLDPQAAAALAAIPYAPLAVVVSAYRRSAIDHPLDGFGFLAPRAEPCRVLGTLFSSSLFEHRAEAETALFTTFLGGRRRPAALALADADLLREVEMELAQRVGARGSPVLAEAIRWPQALPQYTPGHLQRMAELERVERAVPGLHFCANYRGGVSIGDCIASAESAAQRVCGRMAMTEA
jgi:oxygen-dependent protoporphyrinogen oxidase